MIYAQVDELCDQTKTLLVAVGRDPGELDVYLTPLRERPSDPVPSAMGIVALQGDLAAAEEDVDLTTWTKAELQDALDAQGVPYPSGATKAELIGLFE